MIGGKNWPNISRNLDTTIKRYIIRTDVLKLNSLTMSPMLPEPLIRDETIFSLGKTEILLPFTIPGTEPI
jgi:hypothetical protein